MTERRRVQPSRASRARQRAQAARLARMRGRHCRSARRTSRNRWVDRQAASVPGDVPMLPGAPVQAVSMPVRHAPVDLPAAATRTPALALVLLGLAVVASTAVALLEIGKGSVVSSDQVRDNLMFVSYQSKYLSLLRLLSIASFLGAGFFGFVQGGARWMTGAARAILVLYLFTACVWVIVGLNTMTLRNFLLQLNSPLIWFLPVGLFIGMKPGLSQPLRIMANAMAWLLTPAMLYFTFHIKAYGRFDGHNPQVMCLSLVLWFATYQLLASPKDSLPAIALRALPVAACALVAVYNQGRSWLLLCVLALLLMTFRPLFLRERRAILKVSSILIFAAAVFAGLWFLLQQNYPLAVEGLLRRLTADTRSEQYRLFFAQFGLVDLLVGKGPEAVYRSSFGRLSYSYFDNQFLWMAFKGGSVIALGYAFLVVLPGLRLLFAARDESDYAAAGTLVLWGLALAGLSTFNAVSFSAQNFFMVVLAGYCHVRLAWPGAISRAFGRRYASHN